MLDLDRLKVTQEKAIKDKDNTINQTFTIRGLPKGFGYTVANTLRRVLLSSIEGTAITSVRINDILHEYTTIKGVKQNVLEIILRLKSVKIKMDEPGMQVINLSAKGAKTIKAKDFITPAGVEIISPDVEIADLTTKTASLSIEAVVEKDTSFRLQDNKLRSEVGRIPVPAIFSPVLIVNYSIKQSTGADERDRDVVTLNIKTDGTVDPATTLNQALEILKELYTFLEVLTTQKGTTKTRTSSKEVEEPSPDIIDQIPIEELALPEKLTKTLKAKYKTVVDLAKASRDDLLNLKGVGQAAVDKVDKALKKYKLSLG